MEVFPSELWLEPWRGGFEQDVVSACDFPTWMSDAARNEIMETAMIDRERNAGWWVNLWNFHEQPHGQELLFLSAAMAACLGWEHVVQDMIDRGAPLAMDRPASDWKWLGQTRMKGPKDRFSLLDLCAWSMRGENAASSLHPSRMRCLDLLVKNGASVEDIRTHTCIELMRHEHLAKWFISNGLKADRPVGPGAIVLDELFIQWPKISPNVHGRILASFIEHGLPVRFADDGASLPFRLAQTVAGLSQIHRLALHPDRSGVSQAFNEALPQIEKRLSLKSKSDQAAFREVFEVMMLDLNTPQAQSLRARARL